MKSKKNVLFKFNRALKNTALWCTGIIAFSFAYDFVIVFLMKFHFLVRKNITEYSMPHFYILLLICIIMVIRIGITIGIFEKTNINKSKQANVKNVISHGAKGLLYGIIGDVFVVFIFFIIMSLQYGLAILGMHKRYGDEWIGNLAIITSAIILITFTVAGVKEGIVHRHEE